MLWALISFLVIMFVLVIVVWVVQLILDMLPIPKPAKTIGFLILALIALIFLISVFSGVYIVVCLSLFCK